MLGVKRYEMIQEYLNVPKEDFMKATNTKMTRFDYDRHKAMYRKCK